MLSSFKIHIYVQIIPTASGKKLVSFLNGSAALHSELYYRFISLLQL